MARMGCSAERLRLRILQRLASIADRMCHTQVRMIHCGEQLSGSVQWLPGFPARSELEAATWLRLRRNARWPVVAGHSHFPRTPRSGELSFNPPASATCDSLSCQWHANQVDSATWSCRPIIRSARLLGRLMPARWPRTTAIRNSCAQQWTSSGNPLPRRLRLKTERLRQRNAVGRSSQLLSSGQAVMRGMSAFTRDSRNRSVK